MHVFIALINKAKNGGLIREDQQATNYLLDNSIEAIEDFTLGAITDLEHRLNKYKQIERGE